LKSAFADDSFLIVNKYRNYATDKAAAGTLHTLDEPQMKAVSRINPGAGRQGEWMDRNACLKLDMKPFHATLRCFPTPKRRLLIEVSEDLRNRYLEGMV
jgi:hypothetical protein